MPPELLMAERPEAHIASFYPSVEIEFSDIATESGPIESPEWSMATDALLEIASTATGESGRPNQWSVNRALRVLKRIRQSMPWTPPSCIANEPGGGIIIEFRFEGGLGRVIELTFYNDQTMEFTVFVHGKIVDMVTV